MASSFPSVKSSGALTLGLFAVSLLATPADAGRTRTMYRMESRPHGAADGVTQAQIRQKVIELAENRGWAVHVRTAGVVEADNSWSNGKHRFTIATVFDDEFFTIRYVSSHNLGHSDTSCSAPQPADLPSHMASARERLQRSRSERCTTEVIHPSYNDFVVQFEEDIAEAVPKLQPAPADAAPVAVADTVDEELRRLDALQAAGILTPSELQAQRRLLGVSPDTPAAEQMPATPTAP